MKRKPKRIGSIAAEKAACIRAFKKYPGAKYAWCLHHEALCEVIGFNADCLGQRGWRGRIQYILLKKYKGEQARRLRNFRPFKPNGHGYSIERLNKEWPNHTWNGRSIFPNQR